MPVNLFVISKLKHSGFPLVKPIRFWVAACQTDKFLGCRLSNQNDFVLMTGKPKQFLIAVVNPTEFMFGFNCLKYKVQIDGAITEILVF
jgi:hypothetical protein